MSYGTVMAESPSSKPAIDAKAMTMIASFSATCDSVNIPALFAVNALILLDYATKSYNPGMPATF
ncbi:hypothetical protein GCM10007923_38540 [Shinella yambaruensis]|uniref:Uncharacterized protein n=1 Tax=Shinella yambaruensis TaxID=415996 RepID=A0ABQ5ZLW6_9HYPH|nr:hypothetical protein GCM10007923_38540 [Shinella yambaruensis]